MKFNPERHHRRSIRLKNYDYSANGYYFITLCSLNRECIFSKINLEASDCPHPPDIIELSVIGKIIDDHWNKIPEQYENVFIDEYIIMPNHMHGILVIAKEGAEFQGAQEFGAQGENWAQAEKWAQASGAPTGGGPTGGGPTGGGPENWAQEEKWAQASGAPTGGGPENWAQASGAPTGGGPENWAQASSAPTGGGPEKWAQASSAPTDAPTVGQIIRSFKSRSAMEYLNYIKKENLNISGKFWQRNYYERIIRNNRELTNIRKYIMNNPYKWDKDENYPFQSNFS